MPAVSVIIPLYNKATTIVRALNSVFAQSLQDFELVVVDDGSTDDGAKVVEENFTDGRLKLVRQRNRGPGAARNRGVGESTSRCVAFLDADDELLPEFLEQNLQNLASHPECALSTCGSWRGRARTLWSVPDGIVLGDGVWKLQPAASPAVVRWASFSMHISVVMRTAPFLELGGFFERGCAFGEDVYLWLQVLLNFPIYREPRPLMWYHTENAGLNVHYTEAGAANRSDRLRNRPILPLLLAPDAIRASCPEEYKALLERYLAYEAMSEALTRTSVNDVATALDLLQRFEAMRSFKRDFAKLRVKLAFPKLAAFLAAARHS
jgi:glycosyltransferase involved in cell wall biosynthesis